MATAIVEYSGDLRTQSTHVKSGITIITDAPTDNHGKGEAFSPTDLLCSSLASCMMTIMGISAKNHGFPFSKAAIEVTKIMAENPRRVSEIICKVKVGNHGYGEKEIRLLKAAALSCPVAKSLHPDIKQDVTFEFEK
ncbi:MAG: OsmC family protein [Flavobacteriales bacterium]